MEALNVLKRLRLERKLTLKQLSDLANLNASTVSMLENGHQRAQEVTLHKLVDGLNKARTVKPDLDESIKPVTVEMLESIKDTGASERGKINAANRLKGKNGKINENIIGGLDTVKQSKAA